MNNDDVLQTARRCRHYAMCKIDFLDTGLCPGAVDRPFVSFFPQGRMDLYSGIHDKRITVTEELVNIADTCNLCGICDRQCHFVTGLRPFAVMKGLKDYVQNFLAGGNIPEETRPDKFHIFEFFDFFC